MAIKHFKTDRRMWFCVSLVLFLVPWFIPMIGKDAEVRPAEYWVFLFKYPDHIDTGLYFLAMFCLSFAVPAVIVGWILQCIIVMVRDRRTQKT